MKSLSPADIQLSTITVAELFFVQKKKKNQAIVEAFTHNFEQIPFDNKSCRHYAGIRASLHKKGSPIGPMDLLIASIITIDPGNYEGEIVVMVTADS